MSYLVFHDLEVLGEHVLSSRSRSQRSVAVMAYWRESTGSEYTVKVTRYLELCDFIYVYIYATKTGILKS